MLFIDKEFTTWNCMHCKKQTGFCVSYDYQKATLAWLLSDAFFQSQMNPKLEILYSEIIPFILA